MRQRIAAEGGGDPQRRHEEPRFTKVKAFAPAIEPPEIAPRPPQQEMDDPRRDDAQGRCGDQTQDDAQQCACQPPEQEDLGRDLQDRVKD